MYVFMLIGAVLFPLGWWLAEIWGSVRQRRILGVISILWSFAIAFAVGSLEHLNANAYFSSASKDLLESSSRPAMPRKG